MAGYTKRIFGVNLCIVALFILDRLAKWLALDLLPSEGFFIIPNMTGLVLERNQGIAYSIYLPQVFLLGLVALIIVFLVNLVIKAYRKKEIYAFVSLCLIIIGAVSNLIDRLRFGYVIDLVVLTGWPVFNLADLYILAGAVWFIIIYFKTKDTITKA